MAKPTIVVHGKPNCVQCGAVTRALDKSEVPYEYIDVSTNEEARLKAKALGYMGAPVVFFTNAAGFTEHWYGFNPDKLGTAIKAVAAAGQ